MFLSNGSSSQIDFVGVINETIKDSIGHGSRSEEKLFVTHE